jgi:hypothetical protein
MGKCPEADTAQYRLYHIESWLANLICDGGSTTPMLYNRNLFLSNWEERCQSTQGYG